VKEPARRGPELLTLCKLFSGPPSVPEWEVIDGHAMPEPYRRLLVHEEHMTVTMEEHWGRPLELRILERRQDGERYARKILLFCPRLGKAVLFGIMRFDFRWCSEEVKDEIVRGQTPLGQVLIEHDVMRRIAPSAYLKITRSEELMQCFELRAMRPMYGRLATIYCDEEAAVELFEVVRPEDE